MSTLEIITAWKDEDYRETLTEEQRAELPKHPAGNIEFADAGEFSTFVALTGGGQCTFHNCCKKSFP